jgi:hypothetical protein
VEAQKDLKTVSEKIKFAEVLVFIPVFPNFNLIRQNIISPRPKILSAQP